MKSKKTRGETTPASRIAATKPAATSHLRPGQKLALDLQADAEHAHGAEREKLTLKAKDLADKPAGES